MTGPSEYGGDAGLVQPEPHKPTAIEEARIQRGVADDQVDDLEASRRRGGARKTTEGINRGDE